MDHSTLLRYNRQIMMTEIGYEGQLKISNATVLIVGLGGLGSPVAMYLAASGVGHLILNDFDSVDLSNLQRQIVHRNSSVGQSKVDSAKTAIQNLNPDIQATGIDSKMDAAELAKVVAGCSAVVDATDNFDIRYALNTACIETATPLVSGAAIRMEGQLAVYRPDLGDSPCFRCLYAPEDEPQERCSETGVLGSVCGAIGALQANEVIKIITGAGAVEYGRLLLFDAARLEWQSVRIPKRSDCPACGQN